jgi:hypothetical protein
MRSIYLTQPQPTTFSSAKPTPTPKRESLLNVRPNTIRLRYLPRGSRNAPHKYDVHISSQKKKIRAHFLAKKRKKNVYASLNASSRLLCLPCIESSKRKSTPLPLILSHPSQHPTTGRGVQRDGSAGDGVRLRPRGDRGGRPPPPHARARRRVRQFLAPAAVRRGRGGGLPRRRQPLPDAGRAVDEPNPRPLQPHGMYPLRIDAFSSNLC